MMNLTVDLWPGGMKDEGKTVGNIALANVSNLRNKSDYVVMVNDDLEGIRWMFIQGHWRNDGMWMLYSRILKTLTGEDEWVPVPSKFSAYLVAMERIVNEDS